MLLFRVVSVLFAAAIAFAATGSVFEEPASRAEVAFGAAILVLLAWTLAKRWRESAKSGSPGSSWDIWMNHAVVPGDSAAADVDPDATWRLLRGSAKQQPENDPQN